MNPGAKRLWDRQPGESAQDYLDFLSWLNCSVRRPLRAAAARLNLRPGRLRTLSTRHRWRGRSLAYDEFRVESARAELDRVLQTEARSAAERAQLFREQEWALNESMVAQARPALRCLQRIERAQLFIVCAA